MPMAFPEDAPYLAADLDNAAAALADASRLLRGASERIASYDPARPANRRPTPLETADDQNYEAASLVIEDAIAIVSALRSAFPGSFPPDAPVTPEGIATLGTWLADVGKELANLREGAEFDQATIKHLRERADELERRNARQAATLESYAESRHAIRVALSACWPNRFALLDDANVPAAIRSLADFVIGEIAEKSNLMKSLDFLLAALRKFPELAEGMITPTDVERIAIEHEKMLRNWGPIPFEIEFNDQDGNARKITYEAGETAVGINPGWSIPEDADWVAADPDGAIEGFININGTSRRITRKDSGNFWRFMDDEPASIEPEPEVAEPEETPEKSTLKALIDGDETITLEPPKTAYVLPRRFAELAEDEKRELLSFDRLTFVTGTILDKDERKTWGILRAGQGREGVAFTDWLASLPPFEGGPK